MNPKLSRYATFIKPLTHNKIVKAYSGITFSLALITIFGIFALKPTLTTILVLQKQISQQQGVYHSLIEKAQNLSIGKENLSKINPTTRQKLDNLIPDKTDVAFLASSIDALARTTQASVSGFQVQPTPIIGDPQKLIKKPLLSEIDFSFNASGSYPGITDLLSKINSSARLIHPVSVNIVTGSNGINMTVVAKAYYLKN